MLYRRPIPVFAGFILSIALLLGLFLPLPYVVLKPGLAENVLSGSISVKGYPVNQANGRLLSTTVLVSTPGSKMHGPELLYNWIKGDSLVLPRAVIYPKRVTTAQSEAQGAKEMATSESNAIAAAMLSLRKNYPKIAERVRTKDINVGLSKTGGPSAGMVFALGILMKVEPVDLLRGRTVAGTGTITPQGGVGPIGGVDQKMEGAARAGATLFLIPAQNCRDITRIPAGLTVTPVASLQEALARLQTADSALLPHCPTAA